MSIIRRNINNSINYPDMPKEMNLSKTVIAISDALLLLLSEKTFDKITVKDICERAEIHRSTFYKYYCDKYDVFEKSLASMLHAAGMNMDFSSGKDKYAAGTEMFKMVKKYRFLFERILIDDATGEARRILQEVAARSILVQSDWMFIGFEMAEQKIVSAHYYSGAVLSVIEWWLREKLQTSVDVMARYLYALNPKKF